MVLSIVSVCYNTSIHNLLKYVSRRLKIKLHTTSYFKTILDYFLNGYNYNKMKVVKRSRCFQ